MKEFTIGGRYNWKNQPERLIYLGPCSYGSGKGVWHQFCKVDDEHQNVWCEVCEHYLDQLEESKKPADEHI